MNRIVTLYLLESRNINSNFNLRYVLTSVAAPAVFSSNPDPILKKKSDLIRVGYGFGNVISLRSNIC